jgi:hypothetical protein
MNSVSDTRARVSVGRQRAELVVRCACALLGLADVPPVDTLRVDVSVQEFDQELRTRFGRSHPEPVYRTESTTERARLMRDPSWRLPKVILRQGAPRKVRRSRIQANDTVLDTSV